jgi:serine/threonine protein kinase
MYYTLAEGVEPLDEYRPGGHLLVMPEDRFCEDRYTIMHRLGYGGYSVVWLARDAKEKRYVALKIGKSESTDRLRREVAALRALGAERNVPEVLDEFEINGRNGRHACYTMACAAGNLASAVYDGLFPVATARALSARLAKIVSSIHKRGYCHGGKFLNYRQPSERLLIAVCVDIRLDNIIAQSDRNIDDLDVDQFKATIGMPSMSPVLRTDDQPLPPYVPPEVCTPIRLHNRNADNLTLKDARNIILADFGQASQPEIDPQLGKQCYIPMRQRAPETLFQPNEIISYPSDIWSLACAIWNILGSVNLFISGQNDRDVLIADHLATFGPDILPTTWQKEWESEDIDDRISAREDLPRARRWHLKSTHEMLSLDPRFEDTVQYNRRRAGIPTYEEDEKQAILTLMRGMLAYNPRDRLDIDAVLSSDWMLRWDYRRSGTMRIAPSIRIESLSTALRSDVLSRVSKERCFQGCSNCTMSSRESLVDSFVFRCLESCAKECCFQNCSRLYNGRRVRRSDKASKAMIFYPSSL